MSQEDTISIFLLLGLAAVALILINSGSSAAASNILMHNSEEYEWIDYRGRNRTLKVRRQVERGSQA